MPVRIVATESVPPAADGAFQRLGTIVVDDGSDPQLLGQAEVLIVRTTSVDRALLEQARCLRVIARTGAGLDRIDLGEATSRRVPVVYAPDAGTLPIAEGTLALIFATTKRLFELRALVTEGRWQDRYDCDVRDLAGMTLGILGLGRIGSEVARLALALGMNVIAHDPWLAGASPNGALRSLRSVTLDELVQSADVLTLHCALNDSSRGIINRDLLSRVKRGAILINASRGGLIADDAALLEALDQGWLSAIGLDVFADEPPQPDSALLNDRRVVSTPHAVGLTRAWNERVFTALASDVRLVLEGARPQFIANPEAIADLRGRRPAPAG